MKTIRIFLMSFFVSASVLVITPGAMAEVAVGKCRPNLQTYSTISGAVSAVAPGTLILVCPGTYPEQVVITQPLTLRGVQSENAANPVITVPAGGFTQSVVAPTNGIGMVFQVLVQGTESGVVNISNIAVDGGNRGAGIGGWFAGIYYQNSSGAMRNIATYGQTGNGYGFSIFLESTTSTAKTIAVSNSSVHDFDAAGIRTNTAPGSLLRVSIEGNSLISSNSPSGNPASGGIDVGAPGTISGNRVITHLAPAGISSGVGIGVGSNATVSNNTVEGWGVGIWLLGDSNVTKTNTVNLASGAMIISGQNNLVEYNSLLNVIQGGAAIGFNCTGTSNMVINNIINDSYSGIVASHGGNIVSPNSFSNVTRLFSPPC